MSESPNIYLDTPDPLSTFLTRLELKAEVYVDGDFCGTWAVDTSGSKRIPFHLIGRGEAWLHFEKDSEQLHDRDLVLFPHDASHIISDSSKRPGKSAVNAPMTNDGDTTRMICGFLEFQNPAIFPALDSLPSCIMVRSRDDSASERIQLLSTLLLDELEAGRAGSYAAINQIAFLLFVQVLRTQVEKGALASGLLNALFDSKIGPVLHAIHTDSQQPWTLESLAGSAAMSRSSFADRFASLVGMTPMKYLTYWRLTQARHMLTTSALSTAQIAEQCGYESEAAFRKAFKKVLGETPGAARKRLIANR
jgi:AraC family transcriptional regulator, activator of mtrCDE